MSADDFLDSLRSEGKLVDRGEFTLDRAEAREKMQKFQLAEPEQYVLRLVEAANLLGADEIRFDISPDQVEATIEGVGLSAEQIDGLYDAALSERSDRDSRALRQLAIALTAAEQIDAAEVRVETAHGKRHITFRRVGDRENVRVRKHVGTRQFIRFYMREKASVGHLFGGLFGGGGSAPERKILRGACSLSQVPVHVDDDQLSRGVKPAQTSAAGVTISTGLETGYVEIVPDHRDADIQLVQHGVRISRYAAPGAKVSVRGAVDSLRLDRDLSQRSFIKNDAWKVLTDEIIECAIAVSLQKFVQARHENDALLDWAPAMICRAALRVPASTREEARGRQSELDAGTLFEDALDAVGYLCRQPLWPSAYPGVGSYTLAELVEYVEEREDKELRYTRTWHPRGQADADRLLLYLPVGPPLALRELTPAQLVEVRGG